VVGVNKCAICAEKQYTQEQYVEYLDEVLDGSALRSDRFHQRQA